MSLADLATTVRAASPRHAQRVDRARSAMRELGPRALSGRCAVMWSGGRDSTACLALAAETWSAGMVIMSWHGELARPELAREVRLWQEERAPHLDILLRVGVAGWHRRHEAVDVDVHAEAADRLRYRRLISRLGITDVVLGLRRSESGYRRRLLGGLIAPGGTSYTASAEWGGVTVHCPIVDWADDDVALYLRRRD